MEDEIGGKEKKRGREGGRAGERAEGREQGRELSWQRHLHMHTSNMHKRVREGAHQRKALV